MTWLHGFPRNIIIHDMDLSEEYESMRSLYNGMRTAYCEFYWCLNVLTT